MQKKKEEVKKLTEKGRPKINSHCHTLHCLDHAPVFIHILHSLFNDGHNDFPFFLKIFPLFDFVWVCSILLFMCARSIQLLCLTSLCLLSPFFSSLHSTVFASSFFWVRNVVSLALSLSMLHCAKISHKQPNVLLSYIYVLYSVFLKMWQIVGVHHDVSTEAAKHIFQFNSFVEKWKETIKMKRYE